MLNIADRPLLTSPRLRLRTPRKEDAGTIQALANDWEVARRLTRLPHPYTLEDAVFFLEEIVPKELVWVIERLEHDPEKWEPVFGKRSCSNKCAIVGVAGLTPDKDTGAVELGYWIGRAFWGQGFATEAAGLLLDYAFRRAGVSVVTAGCFTDNDRSLRLLRKLGFAIKGQSLRFCLAEQRELPHYDLVRSRPAP